MDTNINLCSKENKNAPLIVLDGKVWDSTDLNKNLPQPNLVSPIKEINPDDIQQIVVLKGTEATELYGNAARNGVIIINLKRKNGLLRP